MALPKEWSDDLKNRFIVEMSNRILVTHILKEPVETTDDLHLFDLDRQESQGTRKLIAMAGPLYSILDHGQILFVDELDARLHPLMTRRIIELFHSPADQPKGRAAYLRHTRHQPAGQEPVPAGPDLVRGEGLNRARRIWRRWRNTASATTPHSRRTIWRAGMGLSRSWET